VDAEEMAVRVVLGQQISTAAARTHAARLVTAHGERVDDPGGGLTYLFPDMAVLAAADPAALAVPQRRRVTFTALAGALASSAVDLGPGSDWQQARAHLATLPGLGPWSIETIAMRGLGDPDAFPAGDLGARAGARQLGLPATQAALTRRAVAWRPWRAYAVQYLWACNDHAINLMPADGASSPHAPLAYRSRQRREEPV
jgi:AraC family transcriptional regulator of adaptative response / DNA-3-methyladenine glycosylase II